MGSVIENQKTKEKCQIFTPDNIVKDMLDYLGYSDNLYGKTILESSCGNGQFLKEIVKRYIEDCKNQGLSRTKIKNGLGRDIFGIELDPVRYCECINELNLITDKFGLKRVKWQIKRADALIFAHLTLLLEIHHMCHTGIWKYQRENILKKNILSADLAHGTILMRSYRMD